MERQIQTIIRQIEELKRENQKTKSAANFLLYSIVELLDEQSGEGGFSSALRDKLNSELGKITMGGAPIIKSAINELMQPPVKMFFSQEKSEPFLK
ncbi:hypothetical protein [Serratia liquefaciens]|uniref:hypothetical protein n=1 Tax=Serratia liquefaciens TaxID=614 RepID=UPI0003586AB1|nr:hypothetical protein [Serratia liquefaciens]AGQ28808.1 hypothetical protein M495_18875 [Serratia liquefaciens ATCC 27592]